MKNLNIVELEIISVDYDTKTDSYKIQFFDASYEDSEIQSTDISRDILVDYIIDNELNRYEFINSRYVNLECDGLDEGFHNPYDYLDENKESVITDYLKS